MYSPRMNLARYLSLVFVIYSTWLLVMALSLPGAPPGVAIPVEGPGGPHCTGDQLPGSYEEWVAPR